MLTPRQQITIENLKPKGIIEPLQIIEYCIKKLDQPRKVSYTKHFNSPRIPRRHHGKQYFQEIINHYAQGRQKESLTAT